MEMEHRSSTYAMARLLWACVSFAMLWLFMYLELLLLAVSYCICQGVCVCCGTAYADCQSRCVCSDNKSCVLLERIVQTCKILDDDANLALKSAKNPWEFSASTAMSRELFSRVSANGMEDSVVSV